MFYRYMKNHYEEHYLKNINKSILTKRIVLEWGAPITEKSEHTEILAQLKRLARASRKKLEDMGLPLVKEEAAAMVWPTYFDTNENPEHEIDICAACFGALIFHGTDTGQEDDPVQRDAAIRTVILLRNADGSWPSHYSVDQPLVYSGTFNETTIALATLMRYGFLDASVPQEYLEKRLGFFRESLKWLVDKKRSDYDGASWGFSPCQKESFSSTMQTAFVYEILVKYRNIMRVLPEEYREETGKLSAKKLDRLISNIEQFFKHIQTGNGGFPKKVTQNADDRECFVNTCMVINALSANPDSGSARDIMEKAADYLIQTWGFKSDKSSEGKKYECGKGFFLTREECFEEFEITVSQKSINDADAKEQTALRRKVFERFPLTLIILSSLSLLQMDKAHPSSKKRDWKALRKYIKKALKLLEGVIVRDGDSIHVKGFRGGDREYPIYNLYYAMLVFNKIIGQGEELSLGVLPVDVRDICGYALLVALLLLFIGLFRSVYLVSAVLTALLGVAVEHLWQEIGNYPHR